MWEIAGKCLIGAVWIAMAAAPRPFTAPNASDTAAETVQNVDFSAASAAPGAGGALSDSNWA